METVNKPLLVFCSLLFLFGCSKNETSPNTMPDDSVFEDFSKGYEGIYGFNFIYSYPKAEGYTPGLVINTYFDHGYREADSFSIRWNEEKKKFES